MRVQLCERACMSGRYARARVRAVLGRRAGRVSVCVRGLAVGVRA